MTNHRSRLPASGRKRRRAALALAALGGAALSAAGAAGPAAASAHARSFPLLPGDLLVSRSVYTGTPGLLQPGVTVLPPGCTTGCVTANSDGSYPQVWNNDLADPSFGVTAPVFLDQLTPGGRLVSTLPVPDGAGDHLVTSFSSKSELALNQSTSGREVTLMGYVAGPNQIDVSNSNTPGVIDPTNPVPGADFRAVGEVGPAGRFRFTETNAYSGNNGRAAILAG